MNLTDKIIFGDNQFFGINHMSQEKAQKMSEKFYDIDEILEYFKNASLYLCYFHVIKLFKLSF